MLFLDYRAARGTRTPNLLLTGQLPYRLAMTAHRTDVNPVKQVTGFEPVLTTWQAVVLTGYTIPASRASKGNRTLIAF